MIAVVDIEYAALLVQLENLVLFDLLLLIKDELPLAVAVGIPRLAWFHLETELADLILYFVKE